MNGFISHLIEKHIEPVNNIIPRLRGRFESYNVPAPGIPGKENFADREETDAPGNRPVMQSTEKPGLGDDNAEGQATHKSNVYIKDRHDEPQPAPFSLQNNNDQTENAGIPIGIKTAIAGRHSFNQILSEVIPNERDHDSMPLLPGEIKHQPSGKKDLSATKQPELIPVIRPVLKKEKPVMEIENSVPQSPSFTSQGLLNVDLPSRMDLQGINQQPATPTVIKVSIGRIEVQAIAPAATVKTNRDGLQKPKMSLDDYLKKRNKTGK
jgi:hypothetical protein